MTASSSSSAAAPPDTLEAALTRVVRAEHVLADARARAGYETDWTRRFHGRARVVVRPGDTAEVAAVVRACRAAGAALVTQGGNTGLVGGGVPAGGEVLVSLARLDVVEPVDAVAGQVTVGAGAALGRLQAALTGTGFAFGVDFAARDAVTLGGMAATDAGGMHVLRHGTMRAQVLGVEAVLADGSVISALGGLLKDTAGYALSGLLVGSEGTLGIITRLRLRLVPRLPARAVALFAVPDTAAALSLHAALRAALVPLSAVELLFADGLALVRSHRGLPEPFGGPGHPAYVLVECEAAEDPLERFAAAAAGRPEVLDVAMGEDRARQAALWAYREGLSDAIAACGVPHKLDVSLPLRALPGFVAEVPRRVARLAPEARTVIFGHLGDGNLHVNVLGLPLEEASVDAAVLGLVAELGGSVSAEHGIGRAKARWLGLTRSEAEIAAMRAIKAALDPEGMLNPGVLLA